MKESYFTPDSILAAAEEMLSKLTPYMREERPHLTPSISALLILDMQNYFLDESSHAFIPSSAAILPGIQALVRSYNRLGLPVVYTRHLNTEANSKNMGVWWRDLISENSPMSDICEKFDTTRSKITHKSQYDAFLGTDLQEWLTRNNVQQVVICGVMTHLCCETTARSAFMQGFQVFFTVDGTATYNRSLHQASLLTLAHGFATPMLTAQIMDRLEEYAIA